MNDYHQSVMTQEILEALDINAHLNSQAQNKYIDATLGTGGHSLPILTAGASVLGIEMDPEAAEIGAERLKKYARHFCLAVGNFKDIDKIAKENGFGEVDGIIFDLGTNNLQLTSKTRGFSFASPEAPLDMRLNPKIQAVTAADLLNVLRPDQLQALFKKVLDFGQARFLTRRITRQRQTKPFQKIEDFLKIVKNFRGKIGLNPATLPFLALRIAVNYELENLAEALTKAYALLKPGGKLIVISFHSAEDAIVKNFAETKLIRPTEAEINENPRARSAKLRIIQKCQKNLERKTEEET